MKKKGIVYVGLSGGVDSAVSAALLKHEGYELVGVFIKAWTPPGFVCTWREDRRSAMRAAAVLGIPFKTLDLEKEYKKDVVDYMIAEYKQGKTPNPDVMCNKEIKFGHFLSWARKQGADFVATGHYAQKKLRAKSLELGVKKIDSKASSSKLQAPSFSLAEGKDKNKDQSYFLWTLTREQLDHVLFPIGHLKKDEVRKLATKYKLPQATRKDSQGLCFLGKIDMKEFLTLYSDTKKGNVLNTKGEIIGTHNGALLYTLGERRGFTIHHTTQDEKAYYVISKNVQNNTIIVDNNIMTPSHKENLVNKISLNTVHWTIEPERDTEILCRYRYRQQKIPCTVTLEHGKEIVHFKTAQEPIASGQSLVFYKDEICLGGGIIGS